MPPLSCAAFNSTGPNEISHLAPTQPLSKLGGAGKLPQLFFVQIENFTDEIEGCVFLKDRYLN
jgi:hypothetical protein